MAELTIVTMHFVWPSLDQAEQCCTYSGCVRMYSLQLCLSGRNVPGVVLRHVPGVVRIMFRGLCGLYSTLSLTGRSAGRSAGQPARASYRDGLRHLKITGKSLVFYQTGGGGYPPTKPLRKKQEIGQILKKKNGKLTKPW